MPFKFNEKQAAPLTPDTLDFLIEHAGDPQLLFGEAQLIFDPPKTPLDPPLASWVPWAAGLFEGEGCVRLSKQDYPVVTINLTDHDTLLALQCVTGGKIHGPYTYRDNPHYKSFWHLYIGGYENVQTIYHLFRPWLMARRRSQFEEVLKGAQEAMVERQRVADARDDERRRTAPERLRASNERKAAWKREKRRRERESNDHGIPIYPEASSSTDYRYTGLCHTDGT